MSVLFNRATGLVGLALLGGLGIPLAASAQDSSNRLEEIVITPSGIPVPRRTIGTSIAVVTQEEIVDHGNLNIVEVLRQESGVAATVSGSPGKTTALRIRGEEGFRTLALFDGIRVSDPSAPQIAPLFEHVQSSGIGRVEILKGPQGLRYGADAGGVINMLSPRAAEGNDTELAAEAGAFGTRQLNGSVSGGGDDLDYFLGVSDLQTEGYNVRVADDVLRDDDGYANTTLHGRLAWALSDSLSLKLVHRNADGESEYDTCFAGVTGHDCLSEYELRASRVALEYQGQGMTQELSYASSDTDRRELADSAFQFGNAGGLERIEYLASLTELPGMDLVFGADWEDAETDGTERNNAGIFVEYLSDFSDNLFLNFGARFDDNADFGTFTSIRSGIAYIMALERVGELKLKTSYGTGFRAPSLFEVAYNNGPFGSPPASETPLRQEQSRGWEAGLELANDRGLHLEAVYFDQRIEDAIEFDLSSFSGYVQSPGSSESSGIELATLIPLAHSLSLRANYTYNETGRPNGEQRLRRPQQLWNLGMGYAGMQERLQINLFYRAARDAIDEVFGTRVRLRDYAVLDVSARYRISAALEVYARVENAADESYEEVSGFVSPERAAYAGIRLRL